MFLSIAIGCLFIINGAFAVFPKAPSNKVVANKRVPGNTVVITMKAPGNKVVTTKKPLGGEKDVVPAGEGGNKGVGTTMAPVATGVLYTLAPVIMQPFLLYNSDVTTRKVPDNNVVTTKKPLGGEKDVVPAGVGGNKGVRTTMAPVPPPVMPPAVIPPGKIIKFSGNTVVTTTMFPGNKVVTTKKVSGGKKGAVPAEKGGTKGVGSTMTPVHPPVMPPDEINKFSGNTVVTTRKVPGNNVVTTKKVSGRIKGVVPGEKGGKEDAGTTMAPVATGVASTMAPVTTRVGNNRPPTNGGYSVVSSILVLLNTAVVAYWLD